MDEDNIALGDNVQAEAVNEMPNKKRIRHRKKQLYQTIRKQMEFYFSDANVSKDRFLGKLIYEDPHVDLSIFLRFNKIRALTTNIKDIAIALKHSELLSVTKDGTKVKRKTPVQEKENTEDCTIYVEQLPPDAQHDWLTEVFSAYGKVAYVSIPKFKNSGKIKGFAFVEFETPEEANKTLEAFGAMGCCLSSQYAPEKLCSIATYEPPESELRRDEMNVKETSEKLNDDESHLDKFAKKKRKRKKGKQDSSHETNEVEPEEVLEEDSSPKKHKIQESESEGIESNQTVDNDAPPVKKRKTETNETKDVKNDVDSSSENLKNTENDKKEDNTDVDKSLESEDPESNARHTKKRKRKRTSENEGEIENKSKRAEADVSEVPDGAEMKIGKKRKKKNADGGEEEEEKDCDSKLQQPASENENNEEVVAPVGDLSEPNVEEEAVAEGEQIAVKKRNRKKRRKKPKKDKQDVEAGRLKILPKREWKRLRNKYLDLQKTKMKCLKQYLGRNKWNNNSQVYHHDQSQPANGQSDEKEVQESASSDTESANTARFTFIPGVVVRITLDQPVVDLRKFKADVKVHGDVKYVDVMLGTTEAFVRFGTATASEQFVANAPWKKIEILEGEKESLYWEKMSKDRDKKFSTNIRVKRRGRDKILRRAERELGKHIRFDD